MLNKSAEGCDAAAADDMPKRSPEGWEDADGAAADPKGSLPHPPELLASVFAGAVALGCVAGCENQSSAAGFGATTPGAAAAAVGNPLNASFAAPADADEDVPVKLLNGS